MKRSVVLFATCALAATCCGGRPGGMDGLVPRPSAPPVFDHSQYAGILQTGSVEGLGKRLCMQL